MLAFELFLFSYLSLLKCSSTIVTTPGAAKNPRLTCVLGLGGHSVGGHNEGGPEATV